LTKRDNSSPRTSSSWTHGGPLYSLISLSRNTGVEIEILSKIIIHEGFNSVQIKNETKEKELSKLQRRNALKAMDGLSRSREDIGFYQVPDSLSSRKKQTNRTLTLRSPYSRAVWALCEKLCAFLALNRYMGGYGEVPNILLNSLRAKG